jgi:hypothetical protein
MRAAPFVVLALAAFGLLSGCQAPLNEQRSAAIQGAEVRILLFEVQKRDKTVRIEVKSPGVPIDAYLVLEKDRDALVKQLQDGGKPGNALAEALDTEEATLEGRIPAGSAFALAMTSRGAKDATVSVKATEKR